jgi:uncharacterized protein YjbJ (UPF0337 family)
MDREFVMEWDRIAGNWKQFTGSIKEQWAKLTDDDLAQIAGKREQLEGKLQELYGHGKENVKKEIDDFIARHKSWDGVAGNWKQFTGSIKEQWGKLTDDDLAQVNGRREQLEGKLQELYGHGKHEAKKEIDDFLARL